MQKTNLPLDLFPPLPTREASRGPHCPICGEAAETFYIDRWGMTVGCAACICAKHKKSPAASAVEDAAPAGQRENRKGGRQYAKTGLFL